MKRLLAALSRAGSRQLQSLVDPSTFRLAEAMSQDGRLSAEGLVLLFLELHPPAALLRDATLRSSVFRWLDREAATELCAALDLDEVHPYRSLQSLAPARGSQAEQQLLDWFGVDLPDEPEVTPLEAGSLLHPRHGLFAHQRAARNQVLAYLDSARPRAFLHMPTGSGKTRTAVAIACRLLQRGEAGLILWLAYGSELCEQATQEFRATWLHHGDRPLTLQRFWGEYELQEADPVDGVVVAGLDKLWARVRREPTFLARMAHRVSLIVFDEAHQSTADVYEHMVGTITDLNAKARLLGLSATPGRTWNEPDKDAALARMYHRQKVTLAVEGHANPINYLVAEGYLAQPVFHQLPARSHPLSEQEVQKLEGAREYSKEAVRKLALDEARNLLLVEKLKELAGSGHKRILFFAATVEHSNTIAALLNLRGLAAHSVTQGTDTSVRRQAIETFLGDAPEPLVLCNYGILTTGFDAPNAAVAVIARPTKSLVLYSQMVGRVIRGPEVGGTEQGEVWTVVDPGLPGFGGLAEAFYNWEDVW